MAACGQGMRVTLNDLVPRATLLNLPEKERRRTVQGK
jgi:hypothetical protein